MSDPNETPSARVDDCSSEVLIEIVLDRLEMATEPKGEIPDEYRRYAGWHLRDALAYIKKLRLEP
jgi:hypothetical protein